MGTAGKPRKSRQSGVDRGLWLAYIPPPRDAGWSSPVARQAHNLKVTGSNPVPATIKGPILTDRAFNASAAAAFNRVLRPAQGRKPVSLSPHSHFAPPWNFSSVLPEIAGRSNPVSKWGAIMAGVTHHKVLIIGGGAAGITVAASLSRRGVRAHDIVIVEPSDTHYYQPAFTLVGAGVYDLARTQRSTDSLVPPGVARIKAKASKFDPDNNAVELSNGDKITYDYLVVCTGLKLDWAKVDGLAEALGHDGVCSNYSPEHVNYTWDCIQALKPGSKAVFTQPPLPFKCPGAPQKIVYLTVDNLRHRGIREQVDIAYYVHAPVIFGVPYFARQLAKIAESCGVKIFYQHNLVAIDSKARNATIEIAGGESQGQRITVPYDMLHVSPPQSPPDEIKSSPLANAAGWVEVNQNSMQHVRYANIFALGDVASTPNSKTAAAVRKQAPVVVRNILRRMRGEAVENSYDGYASCPLTTANGKAIIAEFVYGGKVTPTLPFLNPGRQRWLSWWIKKSFLPVLYWNYMLKGHEWFPKHNTAFKEPPA
jgi:sulfide:quinone oxidoreductase